MATTVTDVDATVAALNVAEGDEANGDVAARNDQRRKRYREAKVAEAMQDGGADLMGQPLGKKSHSHEAQLAARRLKDRQRYASMTPEQRQAYNAKRREQYHRQSENSRVKRRERERARYHSLTQPAAKERNARRARLERERYQRLSPEELEAKNRKRRERAALARQKKNAAAAAASTAAQAAAVVADVEERMSSATAAAAAAAAAAASEAAADPPESAQVEAPEAPVMKDEDVVVDEVGNVPPAMEEAPAPLPPAEPDTVVTTKGEDVVSV